MAEKKSMSHLSEKEETPSPTPQSEYIEFRIPRFSNIHVPFWGMLGLMLLSFAAGFFGNQLLNSSSGSAKAEVSTDLPAAFLSYARKLNLDTKKFQECYTRGNYLSSVDTDIQEGEQVGINATPSFFINGQPLVGALPYDVFKQMIEHELTGAPLPTPQPSETPAPKQTVAKGHLPVLGNNNAKVTIVEFSDFQCPFCERFFTNTYPQLKKEYIDTGKAALYYRHFPLTSIHPAAKPAALASECANEQGKFWQYHDLLFRNQSAWANLPVTAAIQ